MQPPDTESPRLRALRSYDVVGTQPEKAFDDLAALAAQVCETPIAFVSLIDDRRQWFKAAVGLDTPSVPREQSPCAHALQARETLVIPDARQDARFRECALVKSAPHARFYAAAPLVTPEGHVLGTLGVAGPSPRSLSPRQAQALKALAEQAVTLLELRRTSKKLRHDALHDALTGLPNRTMFAERLGRCLARARREPGYRYAVLFLDLDRFKVVNDSLGHAAGDQLLVAIARGLEACVRGAGAAADGTPGATVARLGGDEFTILLEGIRGESDASALAAAVLKTLNGTPYRVDGHEVFTGASIGIVHGDARYERPDDLLRDADAAMYRAKASGKDCWEAFETSMHEAALAWLRLDRDLRLALERQELVLFYQPIVSLETGALAGFEALARWRHPQRGLVPPLEFIPVAEETGLIVPLGRWAMEAACRQLRQWQVRHPRHKDLTVSVNLSKREFRDPLLVPGIARVLAETGVNPRSLKLEITESAVMEQADGREVLERIKSLGVRLQMDDFGTGYSSLSCLHRFPLDGMKIDRAFVRNVSERREYAAVVHAIITLARNLDIEVVAEGVETAEQVALLQGLDCMYAQGYYFAKPLPVDAAEQFLLQQGMAKSA